MHTQVVMHTQAVLALICQEIHRTVGRELYGTGLVVVFNIFSQRFFCVLFSICKETLPQQL